VTAYPRSDERGTVAVSSLVGVVILLLFLLLSTQVLVHLYATSTVTAVAFDTARRASVVDGACPPEAVVRDRLGRWGRTPDVSVRCARGEDGATTVTIAGPSPAAALGRAADAMGLGGTQGWRLERTASFRTEVAP
jgi:hypothetical protein